VSAATIPELRAALSRAIDGLMEAMLAAERGEPEPVGRYTAARRFELADEALENAVWRQAVESHRSVQRWADDRRRYSDEGWWWIWRDVLSRRWALAERRGAPSPFLPSTELAVRDPGAVSREAVRTS
jgi:hypothetical protein